MDESVKWPPRFLDGPGRESPFSSFIGQSPGQIIPVSKRNLLTRGQLVASRAVGVAVDELVGLAPSLLAGTIPLSRTEHVERNDAEQNGTHREVVAG